MNKNGPVNEPSALQPIWDWTARTLGVGYFEFRLCFLPVVVAVVLVTGVFFPNSRREGLPQDFGDSRVDARPACGVHLRRFGGFAPDPQRETPSHCARGAQGGTDIADLRGSGRAADGHRRIFHTYRWHRLEHGSPFVFKHVH